MKKLQLLPLSLLCLACGGPNSGSQADGSSTEQGVLARTVSGVSMLSADVNYDDPCNYLGEEYVRGTFELGASTKIVEVDMQSGCKFEWDKNKEVVVSFSRNKPFPSVYQAEYEFDRLYQPQEFAKHHRVKQAAFTGPDTEDTDAEGPTAGETGKTAAGTHFDSTATNDSSRTVARIPASATHLTTPAQSNSIGKAVSGIGDKAIWEESKHTLHVLYLHHIVNVMVNSGTNSKENLDKAKELAAVFLDRLVKEGKGGIETPPDPSETVD